MQDGLLIWSGLILVKGLLKFQHDVAVRRRWVNMLSILNALGILQVQKELLLHLGIVYTQQARSHIKICWNLNGIDQV